MIYRVYGVSGLLVVDASITPRVPCTVCRMYGACGTSTVYGGVCGVHHSASAECRVWCVGCTVRAVGVQWCVRCGVRWCVR